MTKYSVKKQLFKGNWLNFAFLTFASLLETALFMCISVMLEKVIAVATA